MLIASIMLMNRALPIMQLKPLPNAPQMKATETFQPAHLLANLKFLEADRAFGVVDAVFFGGFIWEHACPPDGGW